MGTESWDVSDLKTMRCSDTAILEVREINFTVEVHWRCETLELLQWVKKKIHLSKTPVSRIPYVQWTFTCSWLPVFHSFLSQMFLQSFQHLKGPWRGEARVTQTRLLHWEEQQEQVCAGRKEGRFVCFVSLEAAACLVPLSSPVSSGSWGSLVSTRQISVLALPPLCAASVLCASAACDWGLTAEYGVSPELWTSRCLGLLLCSCHQSFLAGSPKVFMVFPQCSYPLNTWSYCTLLIAYCLVINHHPPVLLANWCQCLFFPLPIDWCYQPCFSHKYKTWCYMSCYEEN